MDLRLDPRSAVPLYAQVVEQVRSLVATRAFRAGEKLPSVRDLAVALRLNRNTVAKAYRALETDGVIETRAGQGCFVAAGSPRWSDRVRAGRLESALDRALVEARHLGIEFETLPDLLEQRIRAFREVDRAQATREEK